MNPGVTVAIPVGPLPAHQRWLLEAVESVRAQTMRANILLIDDMADVPRWCGGHWQRWEVEDVDPAKNLDPAMEHCWGGSLAGCYLWAAPWHLGVAHAFNFGVALAPDDLVFMLGADDELEPECLERCVEAWEATGRQDAYFWVPITYMDTGEQQGLACNAAMVTKGLWRRTGGFAPESAVGAPDAAFISSMLAHHPEALVRASGPPLYRYRRHGDTDTATRGPWQGAILESRRLLTELWSPPAWGRDR